MKKLTKRTLSAIIAASCMLSASAISTHAIFIGGTANQINSYLAGYKEFDDGGYFSHDAAFRDYGYRTFYNDRWIATVTNFPAYFYFEVPDDVSSKVGRMLFHSMLGASDSEWEWGSEWEWNAEPGYLNPETNTRRFYIHMGKPKAENTKVAKDFFNFINDKYEVTSFELCENPVSYIFWFFEDYANTTDEIQKFLSEYGQFSADEISEMTMEEYMIAANQIKDETGHCLGMWCQESVEKREDIIDVLNSIESDANEDGEVNIADAAAIVRHMGNPDLYALTPQGYFNADIDGDGLTGADAIEIQYKVIKAGMPQ
ncbi:MAG: dockerin type I repeat-containing protein [Ruminococcus sp.]|nr:dockerin type I repeat-containing protein [Ruminococcus sp.]